MPVCGCGHVKLGMEADILRSKKKKKNPTDKSDPELHKMEYNCFHLCHVNIHVSINEAGQHAKKKKMK